MPADRYPLMEIMDEAKATVKAGDKSPHNWFRDSPILEVDQTKIIVAYDDDMNPIYVYIDTVEAIPDGD